MTRTPRPERILIKLDPDTLASLRTLADTSGYTVNALIRHLVDTGLPALAARLSAITK